MNNNPGQEILIYAEEHTRIGETQVSKQTILHATDGQLVFDNCFCLRIDRPTDDAGEPGV